MCGRYALALPPGDIGRRLFEDNLPVDDAPNDDDVQPGYNIAPGSVEPVYRALPGESSPSSEGRNGEGSSSGANSDGGNHHQQRSGGGVKYVLTAMKWGLVPSWTKTPPAYSSLMKTINCRDDSLVENKGMWTSMKHKKRCVVVAMGFYEWAKKGAEKIPHFVKRKDGKLMLLAGLWDCVQYEDSTAPLYTYTIITTAASPFLTSLHTRMPAILENTNAKAIQAWLDPNTIWTKELQGLLKPYEGELECYRVAKEVGNARKDEKRFVLPIDEGGGGIKQFFGVKREEVKKEEGEYMKGVKVEEGVKGEEGVKAEGESEIKIEDREEGRKIKIEGEDDPPRQIKTEPWDATTSSPLKRERDSPSDMAHSPPPKTPKIEESPQTTRMRSAKKKTVKSDGTPKITSFFGK